MASKKPVRTRVTKRFKICLAVFGVLLVASNVAAWVVIHNTREDVKWNAVVIEDQTSNEMNASNQNLIRDARLRCVVIHGLDQEWRCRKAVKRALSEILYGDLPPGNLPKNPEARQKVLAAYDRDAVDYLRHSSATFAPAR